ncbi:hypothetical protein SAMN05660649_04794 [Desulfotomaculum arcticum]|uniref:Uncharacterized protein n=1 Tax=Desulfotruncus arcticus DSM 17038 TaxID=1121424 RepID=A0A1I2Z892_9FIRM|nr:hypothetical protein SAMN05660649_04794 [Desulfotomaculum arcticum] [Desulfotruncus arcticus DSM 17038]
MEFTFELNVPFCAKCGKSRNPMDYFDTDITYFFCKLDDNGLPYESIEICENCYNQLSPAEKEKLNKNWVPM